MGQGRTSIFKGCTPDTARSSDAMARAENAALRRQLAQLEEAMRAIRGREVDALFVADDGGGQVFSLTGADHGYRALIEQMGEGALTLSPTGMVMYANRRFAELLGLPLNQVIGTPIFPCFAPEGHASLASLLADGQNAARGGELDLLTADGQRVPIMLSVSGLALEGLSGALAIVVTDLTWQRRSEAATLARENLLAMIARQKIAEENLRVNMATLRLRDNALGAISQGVLITDAQGRTTYMNPACEKITGYTAAEMAGRTASILQGAETSDETRHQLRHSIAASVPFHGELVNYRKDGHRFWNALSITPVLDANGATTQFVGVMRDVSERRQADVQMMLSARVLEQSGEGTIITDAACNLVKVNQAFTAITGYEAADVAGLNLRTFTRDRNDRSTFQAIWDQVDGGRTWSGELQYYRKDGRPCTLWQSISQLVDLSGKVTHHVASFSDITQRKEAEELMRHQAHFDQLTGLPNRSLLGDRATQALRIARRNKEPLALMFLDLDHFKHVNDSLGHAVGDQLLVALATRVKAALREQDTLSRIGGDEFVLLLPNTSGADAVHVVHKLLQLTQQPYQLGPHELTISPSIGIAIYPKDGSDFDELAKCADAAMYRAKQAGRNTYCLYTAELHAQSTRLPLIETALRRALERDQLHLHYQPQRSLNSSQIVGAEALLRWHHPELGWVSPGEFIPIAESSGLIASIGEWVLRTAVRQMKDWIDIGMAPMVIAVNLSAVQFQQPDLPERVHRILQEVGLPPRYLELELTESVASNNPEAAITSMNKLHAYGVRMSIDDFGTGYSSLSYLKRFKIHKLKIDQSFVGSVTADPDDQAIVTAIIGMAKSLGMQTIAEGVETEAQMDYLRNKGCDEMQGYWFSRPLTADRFKAFVDTHASAAIERSGNQADWLAVYLDVPVGEPTAPHIDAT